MAVAAVGRPHAAIASYASDCRPGRHPWVRPTPWTVRRSRPNRCTDRSRSACRRWTFASDRAPGTGRLRQGQLLLAPVDALPQRSRPGVAGVGERGASRREHLVVHVGEGVLAEEHLAAHLEQLGHRRSRRRGAQLLRDPRDEPRVVGDVLADPAVASGGDTGQAPGPVDQVDGQPVDLQFAQQGGQVAEVLADPAQPQLQLVEAERVVQAEQPLQVLDGGEHAGAFTADGLGGRLAGHELRVGLFEFGQFPEQHVVLGVGQRRMIRTVVLLTGRVDPIDQFLPPLPRVRHVPPLTGSRWLCGLCGLSLRLVPPSEPKGRVRPAV